MQLLDGTELQILVDETDWDNEPLPICWAAAIGAQIAAVLVEVHERSIVHRDLKPRNLYLTPGGIVKVLDFGVAALLRGDDTTRLTRMGQTVGTPPYMAPEQVLAGTVSPATDVYGLGCVLHELLVGRPPFTGGHGMSVPEHHVRTPPTPIRTLRADVPADVETLILAMLAKTAKQRPAAAHVYDVLLPLAGRMVAVFGYDEVNPCQPFVRPMAATPAARRLQAPPVTPSGEPPLSNSDVDAIHEHVVQLVGDEQLTQAIDLLDTALARGGAEDAMADLRRTLAATLFLASSYRRALAQFEEAARGYTHIYGSNDDLTLECRYQAALCRAEMGEFQGAFDALQRFLGTWQRVKGPDNERALSVRQQIAVLLASLGRPGEARAAFTDLRRDLARLAGHDSPAAAAIDEQIARIDRYDKLGSDQS